jgi:hypothetical protein
MVPFDMPTQTASWERRLALLDEPCSPMMAGHCWRSSGRREPRVSDMLSKTSIVTTDDTLAFPSMGWWDHGSSAPP